MAFFLAAGHRPVTLEIVQPCTAARPPRRRRRMPATPSFLDLDSKGALMHAVRRLALVLAVTFLASWLGLPVGAAPVTLTQEAYLTPPKEIADAVLATRQENHTLTNI